MSNYLETVYFRDEYSKDAYPQKLCNYIFQNIIKKKFSKEYQPYIIGEIISGKNKIKLNEKINWS